MIRSVAVAGWLVLSVGACKSKEQPAPTSVAPEPVKALPAPVKETAVGQPPVAAADYDPMPLLEGGVPVMEVYKTEARHPAWAPTVEAVVGGAMRADLERLVPSVRRFAMTCKTLSCLVEVDAPPKDLAPALLLLNLVTLGPVTRGLDPTPEGQGGFVFVTDRRMADPVAFTSWYRKTRKRMLDDLRARRAANQMPFPVDKLPSE